MWPCSRCTFEPAFVLSWFSSTHASSHRPSTSWTRVFIVRIWNISPRFSVLASLKVFLVPLQSCQYLPWTMLCIPLFIIPESSKTNWLFVTCWPRLQFKHTSDWLQRAQASQTTSSDSLQISRPYRKPFHTPSLLISPVFQECLFPARTFACKHFLWKNRGPLFSLRMLSTQFLVPTLWKFPLYSYWAQPLCDG